MDDEDGMEGALLIIGREVDTPFTGNESLHGFRSSGCEDQIVLRGMHFCCGRVERRDDGVDRVAV